MDHNKISYRYPKYMKDFKCTGADCEFHCCMMWTISIEQPIYDKLKSIMCETQKMRKRFNDSIMLNPDPSKSLMDYAHIKLLPNKICPFYEDKLCSIQKQFGENMLSSTCSIYPRKQYMFNGRMEVSANCSCSEVSRRLLLDKDALDLQTADQYFLARKLAIMKVKADDESQYRALLDPVRDFMISMIEQERYTLEDRLFFITFFAKRTASFFHKNMQQFDKKEFEMEILFLQRNLDEIKHKLHGIETPIGVMLILINKILMTSKSFEVFLCGDVANRVLNNYKETVSQGDQAPLLKVWEVYHSAKKNIIQRAGSRIDQYIFNISKDYWINNWYIQSTNLLEHMEKLLIRLGVFKFLLFSQPELIQALDQENTEEGFLTVLDNLAVEVLYKIGRYLDHSPIVNEISAAMENDNLPIFIMSLYLLKL